MHSQLGAGGMAEVWRATLVGPAGFGREVAIKMVRSDRVEDTDVATMLIDEARLSANLRHKNIVATIDFGFEAGDAFIVMEMVDGVALRSCLRKLRESGERFDVDVALHLVAETAAALDYAHNAVDGGRRPLGIIHRDVTPANIMLSLQGEVKLADFGIAKAVQRGTKTATGSLKGTLAYMSPEQAWGWRLDHRSDVYTLGLTLYELIANRRAIGGSTDIDLLNNAREARHEPLGPEVSPELRQVVETALRRDPAERFPTAAAFKDALLALVETQPPRDRSAALGKLVARIKREQFVMRGTMRPAVSVLSVNPTVAVEGPERTTGQAGTAATEIGALPRRRIPLPKHYPLWIATGLTLGLATLLMVVVGSGAPQRSSTPSFAPHPRLDAAAAQSRASAAGDAAATDRSRLAANATQPTGSVSRDANRALRQIAPPRAVQPPPRPSRATKRQRTKATLRIQVEPWGHVTLDGRALGMTPLPPIEVSPGRHTIVAVNPRRGQQTVTVLLRPGQTRLLQLKLARPPAPPAGTAGEAAR